MPTVTCGVGAWITGPTSTPRVPQQYPSAALQSIETTAAHPTVWRAYFPADVVAYLVSINNSKGYVTNYYLDLVVGFIDNKCTVQCFDVQ